MEKIIAGALLAERYRLSEPVASDVVTIEAWRSQDQILDRPVRVSVVSGPRAGAALDEARRAALVSDPRLVRVLDVGSTDTTSYVVTEPFAGADLAALVSAGPLPADQARAIVGEAASAVEAARARGLHHLALRPQVVRVLDGRVTVTGLGVDGAMNPQGRANALSASRADAVGLVSLLFYALTGTWPGDTLTALPLRPEVLPPVTAATDPRELVADTPDDLAELCVSTLDRDHTSGARTSADVVRALEPWGPVTAVPPPVFAAVNPTVPESPAADHAPARAEAERPAVVRHSVIGRTGPNGTSAVPPGTPPPAIPPRRTSRVLRTGVIGAGAAVGAAASTGTAAAGAASGTATPDASATGTASASSPAMAARSATPSPSAGRPAPGPTTRATPPPDDRPFAFDELVSAPREYRRFRFNPTAFTLVLVLVAVLVGAYVALNGITSGLTSPFESRSTARPEPTQAAEAEPGATAEPTPEPTETTPVVIPVIASGQQLDPMGDGDEHPEAVDRAYDEDPSTFWFTRTYSSPTFAGMTRTGIGYAVRLAEPAEVSTIYLSTNNTGGQVEVRAVDPADPTQGAPLATETFSREMQITLDQPVTTEYIVLWFTELPQNDEGANRVELREISMT